ncbi:MAG: hypothetical protein L0332_33935 [Chloroflexi bacterium]|nr:hypothetical protein [Chloroflexota bacterium]MCI0574622.1 hypothetical protein [Chloroflexota bacterium]MCI0644026.1 hypothetical protein [Chloroflexota bacterium]MCI0731700.1 hypothetical protein [Chloroflexota bacterium]
MPESDISKLQGKRTVVGQTPTTTRVGEAEHSAAYQREVLDKIRKGLATKVRILANHDSCPVCRAVEGAYDFDEVPELPLEGCSHPMGCRCYYAPVLDLFGP